MAEQTLVHTDIESSTHTHEQTNNMSCSFTQMYMIITPLMAKRQYAPCTKGMHGKQAPQICDFLIDKGFFSQTHKDLMILYTSLCTRCRPSVTGFLVLGLGHTHSESSTMSSVPRSGVPGKRRARTACLVVPGCLSTRGKQTPAYTHTHTHTHTHTDTIMLRVMAPRTYVCTLFFVLTVPFRSHMRDNCVIAANVECRGTVFSVA